MPQNERRSHRRIANAGILISMEIAAANPRYLDAQKRFVMLRRAGARHPFDAQVRRAVQARGQHGLRLRSPELDLAFAHFACLLPALGPSARPACRGGYLNVNGR